MGATSGAIDSASSPSRVSVFLSSARRTAGGERRQSDGGPIPRSEELGHEPRLADAEALKPLAHILYADRRH